MLAPAVVAAGVVTLPEKVAPPERNDDPVRLSPPAIPRPPHCSVVTDGEPDPLLTDPTIAWLGGVFIVTKQWGLVVPTNSISLDSCRQYWPLGFSMETASPLPILTR